MGPLLHSGMTRLQYLHNEFTFFCIAAAVNKWVPGSYVRAMSYIAGFNLLIAVIFLQYGSVAFVFGTHDPQSLDSDN